MDEAAQILRVLMMGYKESAYMDAKSSRLRMALLCRGSVAQIAIGPMPLRAWKRREHMLLHTHVRGVDEYTVDESLILCRQVLVSSPASRGGFPTVEFTVPVGPRRLAADPEPVPVPDDGMPWRGLQRWTYRLAHRCSEFSDGPVFISCERGVLWQDVHKVVVRLNDMGIKYVYLVEVVPFVDGAWG